MRWIAAALYLAALACGRIDFDPLGGTCGPSQIVDAPFANSTAGATGSAGDPFLICTAVQLDAIGATPSAWASSFQLGRDLDVTGMAIAMIGTDAQPFTGSFDGNGHAIIGLAYDAPAANEVGLFASCGIGAVFHDVALQAVNIVGGRYVGALVGYGEGVTIDRVAIDGALAVSGSATNAGGIAGYLDCSVTGCGIGPVVSNSTAAVDVQCGPGNSSCGGMVGGSYVGPNSGNGVMTFTNDVSSGTVAGLGLCGGLIGDGEPVVISQSSSSVTITHSGGGGGLAGDTVYGNLSVIEDSFATGDVTCTSSCGGLGGTMEGSITRSHATGMVTTQGDAGGLVGDISNAVTQSWASGDVTGGQAVGGLAGLEYGSGITDSYATGTITGTLQVGGVAGMVDPQFSGTPGTVARCYSSSTVIGGDVTGGLLGQAGMSSSNPLAITDSFAVGSVSGASTTGGISLLVAAQVGTVTINAIYDATTATCTNSAGTCMVLGTAEPAAYFQAPTNDPMTRWDFSTVWQANAGALPTLR